MAVQKRLANMPADDILTLLEGAKAAKAVAATASPSQQPDEYDEDGDGVGDNGGGGGHNEDEEREHREQLEALGIPATPLPPKTPVPSANPTPMPSAKSTPKTAEQTANSAPTTPEPKRRHVEHLPVASPEQLPQWVPVDKEAETKAWFKEAVRAELKRRGIFVDTPNK